MFNFLLLYFFSDSDSDLEDGPPFQKAPVEPSMPSFLDSEQPIIERQNHNTVAATRPPQRPLIPQQQPSSGM